MNVVFDLDGTLADVSHRLHHIQGGKRDWDAFHRDCPKDKPIWQTVETFKALGAHTKVNLAIWTGRDESVRDETAQWLVHNLGFQYSFCDLKMRPVGDYTEDHFLKERWFNEARQRNFYIHLAFDDRQRVVDMWRNNGVVCYQVDKGNF